MESQRRNEREDELEKVKASMASEKQREMADCEDYYDCNWLQPGAIG